MALPGLTVDAQFSITKLIDGKLNHRVGSGEDNSTHILEKLVDSVDVSLSNSYIHVMQHITKK